MANLSACLASFAACASICVLRHSLRICRCRFAQVTNTVRIFVHVWHHYSFSMRLVHRVHLGESTKQMFSSGSRFTGNVESRSRTVGKSSQNKLLFFGVAVWCHKRCTLHLTSCRSLNCTHWQNNKTIFIYIEYTQICLYLCLKLNLNGGQ